MARLLGQADATLVSAAYKAGKANVPKDLNAVYMRMGRAMQRGAEAIGQRWKAAGEAAGKAAQKLLETNKTKVDDAETDYGPNQLDDVPTVPIIDPLKDDATLEEQVEWDKKFIDATLYPDKYPHKTREYYFQDNEGNNLALNINNVEEQIQTIRDERVSLRWMGENREEYTREERKVRREELRVKEANLRSSAGNFRAFQERMNTLLPSGNINIEATGGANLSYIRAVNNNGKPLEDGSKVIMGFTDKGKMVFNWIDKFGNQINDKNGKPYSADMATIENYIVQANPTVRGAIDLAMDPKPHRDLGKKGNKYNPIPVKDAVDAIQDKNAFLDAVNYGKGMNASLAATLHGVKAFNDNDEPIFGDTLLSTEVFAALNSLGDKYNYDGKGDVNAADFSTPENYKKLVDAILSGEDLGLGKTVLRQHLHNENRVPYGEEYTRYLMDNPEEAKRLGYNVAEDGSITSGERSVDDYLGAE